MTVQDRARRYIANIQAISGSGGHDTTYRVSAILRHGFSLSADEAFGIMWDWNQTNSTPPWSEAEIRHKLDSFNPAGGKNAPGYLLQPGDTMERHVSPAPRAAAAPKRAAYDAAKLALYAKSCSEKVDKAWLADRSKIRVEHGVREGLAADFLSYLYEPEDVVLIFTDFRSQGDFSFWKNRTFRLGDKKGIAAVPSGLPTAAKEGVWFLTNPVKGSWEIYRKGDLWVWGRRHGACVTSWRYLVLESDEAPVDLWLKALVLLRLPIAAIYTSGGKSVHALVRIDARSKGEFDRARDAIVAALCPLGADGGAISGVRLSRLPGCNRGEKGIQELLYLNPKPLWKSILELPGSRHGG